MDGEPSRADSPRPIDLAQNLRDKRYRDSYVAAQTRQILARQVRNFRGTQSQDEFAEEIGKRQTQVSRFENPGYGAWTLRSMFEVARRLDVAVFARFVDFPTFLQYSGDLSDTALRPKPYDSAETECSVLDMSNSFRRDLGDLQHGSALVPGMDALFRKRESEKEIARLKQEVADLKKALADKDKESGHVKFTTAKNVWVVTEFTDFQLAPSVSIPMQDNQCWGATQVTAMNTAAGRVNWSPPLPAPTQQDRYLGACQ